MKRLNTLLAFVFLFGASLAQPTITSFSPINGVVGTSVTITGTGFITTPSGNIVFFGGAKADVTSASSTSLTVKVPHGATYAPISVYDSGKVAQTNLPFNPIFIGGNGITSTTFQSKVDLGISYPAQGIKMVDLDGDGKLDMVASIFSSITVYRNMATEGNINVTSFPISQSFAVVSNSQEIAFGDLDGDGKIISQLTTIVEEALKVDPKATYVNVGIQALNEGQFFMLPSYLERQDIKETINRVDYSNGKYYEVGGSKYKDENGQSKIYGPITGEEKTIQEMGKLRENGITAFRYNACSRKCT